MPAAPSPAPAPGPAPAPATAPTLPPETALAFWVPIIHYALAAVLIVGAAMPHTFSLSPALQAMAVLGASALVVIGSAIYALIHKVSLRTLATYLKSSVPGLLGDVSALKAAAPAATASRVSELEQTVVKLGNLLDLHLPAAPPVVAPVATEATPLPVVVPAPSAPSVVTVAAGPEPIVVTPNLALVNVSPPPAPLNVAADPAVVASLP